MDTDAKVDPKKKIKESPANAKKVSWYKKQGAWNVGYEGPSNEASLNNYNY